MMNLPSLEMHGMVPCWKKVTCIDGRKFINNCWIFKRPDGINFGCGREGGNGKKKEAESLLGQLQDRSIYEFQKTFGWSHL